MDKKVDQQESPGNHVVFRCEDKTAFIYSKGRGLYLPCEKKQEDQERPYSAGRKKARNPFTHPGKKMRFWITTVISVAGVVVVGIYTFYAKLQVEYATKAVAGAEKSMRIDERAWLTVSEVTSKGPDYSGMRIVIVNTGRTPAEHFTLSAGSDLNGKKTENQKQPSCSLIPPNGKFISLLQGNGSLSISTELAIHGRIDYESIFGTPHWTTFCYRYVRGKTALMSGFSPCEAGNDIDHNVDQ